MSSSIQAARAELASLSDFQREIHITNDPTEEIMMYHYKKFTKSTWYSSVLMKLESAQDGAETTYRVNNSFHFLLYSYICFNLPAVRVKPEYSGRVRIAWCHNIGTNIVDTATFKEDDDPYHTWDNVWADIYYMYYQNGGAGKRESHNIGIGNIDYLEQWT